jgi:predicted  nucleic acid-binding Zn-ribbon protein
MEHKKILSLSLVFVLSLLGDATMAMQTRAPSTTRVPSTMPARSISAPNTDLQNSLTDAQTEITNATTIANDIQTQSCEKLTETIKATTSAIDKCNQALEQITIAKGIITTIKSSFSAKALQVQKILDSIKSQESTTKKIESVGQQLTDIYTKILDVKKIYWDPIKAVKDIPFVVNAVNGINNVHKPLIETLPQLIKTMFSGSAGTQKDPSLRVFSEDETIHKILDPTSTLSQIEGVTQITEDMTTGITGITQDLTTFFAQKEQIEQDLSALHNDLTTKETEITQQKNTLIATKTQAENAKNKQNCPA